MATLKKKAKSTKTLSNADFVESLYRTLLKRPSDPEGKAAHVKSLEDGMSRDDLVLKFKQSEEYLAKQK